MNRMYLNLGDWSNDGHGKYDKILLESNVTVEEIQQAYKNSCKLTGVSFNHNDDFTGLNRQDSNYIVCAEYEESDASKECKEVLSKYGITCDIDYEIENFVRVWIEFVKLSLPKGSILNEVKDEIPNINGYWGDLNVQFGYGLYY